MNVTASLEYPATMHSTVISLDDDLLLRVARVRAHAEDVRNWYIAHAPPPTWANPRLFTVQTGNVQACFTITVMMAQGKCWRHLSVSLKEWHDGDKQAYANPRAVLTLARLFGFVEEGWEMLKNEMEGTMVAVQVVRPGELPIVEVEVAPNGPAS